MVDALATADSMMARLLRVKALIGFSSVLGAQSLHRFARVELTVKASIKHRVELGINHDMGRLI
ncbi:hypothetical protein GCM10007919_05620 [Rhizobium indigoferae]|nr:hypothetical protein GCM10007919_05620 [Rhizobium indigoferae]